MCTILFAYQCHPVAPLVIAANRDELYARPTRPAMVLDVAPRVVGGQDVEHAGTWLGLREDGFFVGLTNLRSWAPNRASRGVLVRDALRAESVQAVDDMLRLRAARAEFRPFNLMYGGGDRLHVAHVTDSGLEIEEVSPGLHVLPSGGRLDGQAIPKVRRGLEGLAQAARHLEADMLVEALLGVLADHTVPPLEALPPADPNSPVSRELEQQVQALCVHTPMYGTRSSAVLLVGGDETRYYYVDGKPCESSARRVDDMLLSPERNADHA